MNEMQKRRKTQTELVGEKGVKKKGKFHYKNLSAEPLRTPYETPTFHGTQFWIPYAEPFRIFPFHSYGTGTLPDLKPLIVKH